MRYFHVLKGESGRDPATLLLLITATPNRSDNLGMEAVCDKITYSYQLDQAIKDGFLADIRAYRSETEVDISKVKTTSGDLCVPDLAAAINTPERNQIIANKYLEIREEIRADVSGGRKPYACVADFVDIAGKHRLICTPSIFGLRETFDAKGKSITETVAAIEKLEEEHPTLDLRSQPNMDAIRTSLTRLDLLKPPEAPEELRRISPFTWLKEGSGAYHLCMMDNSMLSIRENTLGGMDIYRHVKGIRTKLDTAADLKTAVAKAEAEIPEKDRRVMAADASWKKDPPSEAQARRLVHVDKKINQKFKGSSSAFFAFAFQRFKSGDLSYSKGSLSARIDAASVSRR